jgi:hypothetical protein
MPAHQIRQVAARAASRTPAAGRPANGGPLQRSPLPAPTSLRQSESWCPPTISVDGQGPSEPRSGGKRQPRVVSNIVHNNSSKPSPRADRAHLSHAPEEGSSGFAYYEPERLVDKFRRLVPAGPSVTSTEPTPTPLSPCARSNSIVLHC